MSWEQEEDDFRDNPIEYTGNKEWKLNETDQIPRSAPRAVSRPVQNVENVSNNLQTELSEEYGEVAQEALDSYEEEEDFTSVLSDANLRLEQGNLYKLIMNHNLFEGLEADPKAIANVQKEVRRFAKERMEIMLGMRAEKQESISGIFNDLEIDVLKRLASTATKGLTETVQHNKNTKQTLSTIKSKTLPTVKPLSKTASSVKPLERKQEQKPPQSDYRPLKKDPSQMTEKELINRNKEILSRQRPRANNPNALPPATPEQAFMKAQAQVMGIGAAATPAGAMMSRIINHFTGPNNQ